MATAPLHACLVQEGLFERGNGTVVLIRKTEDGRLAMAAFLADVYCLGVKDVVFQRADAEEIDALVAVLGEEAPFDEVDPAYARKLLRDLVAWARILGLEPHADYAAVELLFGTIDPDACDASFDFGLDGKPLYIPGPGESPSQVRRRIAQLRRRLGDDGFDVMVAEADDDAFDDHFDLDDALGYNPDTAPDPEEWLARDEDERLIAVRAYHRRAGIEVPNEVAHAGLHVIVENQIAAGDPPPVQQAMERLMAGGLDRHEAVHAVAAVVADQIHAVMSDKTRLPSPDAYVDAVEALTVESWRRRWEGDDEPDSL
ncbi:MAG TPA: DUF1841 family protein [Alphaproteobacteria bacterium]|nr:DUF1841 family protein [Alphaproteobacteria bacterium]